MRKEELSYKRSQSTSIIIGRQSVINKAREMVDKLKKEIYITIKPYGHEVLFNLVFMFLNLSALLSKKREAGRRLRLDITWIRVVIAMTTALNYLLPSFIPLKPLSRLEPDKFKKSFEVLPYIASKLFDLAKWLFVLENKYINKIIVQDSTPDMYWSEEYREAIVKYVDILFSSDDYLDWLDWFYPRLRNYRDFINALDEYLLRRYGFKLDDLSNASESLECLYSWFKERKELPIIHKNKLHEVFIKNIRDARASRLLNALIFDKGKDLMRSPLIPLEGGDLLIAGWVFELRLHFDAWIKLAMEEEPRLWDMYANIAGREFEEYVASKVSELGYKVFRNVVVSEKEFPQISECLRRLGKRGFFELDIVVIAGNRMYVISCKGGKKEIPKLYKKSKYWVFLSEKEVIDRLNENIREAREIIEEARCLQRHRDIVAKLFSVDIEEVIPVLIYAFPQPLVVDEFKTRSGLPDDIIIATPGQLPRQLSDASSEV